MQRIDTQLDRQPAANQSFEMIVARDELNASPEIWHEDWLHPRELAELSRLRDGATREGFRLARWAAKQLICEARPKAIQPLREIAICSRNERRQSVRPGVTIAGQDVPWSLSISHSERLIAAVLDTRPGVSVGIDVAARQRFRSGFLRTWFLPSEQDWARSGPMEIAPIIWAAKEAVYKAFNAGESFAPHMVEILEAEWDQSPAEPRSAQVPSMEEFSSAVGRPERENIGAVETASGRLSARYRGRDIAAECEIEYRVLEQDVVVVARRWMNC